MKKAFITLFILSLSTCLFAWPGGSGSGSGSSGGPGFDGMTGTDNTLNNGDVVPVDGGIVTVTALAIGYGVRRARKKKEDQNNDQGAV